VVLEFACGSIDRILKGDWLPQVPNSLLGFRLRRMLQGELLFDVNLLFCD